MLKTWGAILFIALLFCAAADFPRQANAAPAQQAATAARPAASSSSQAAVAKPHPAKSVVYTNTEYGFKFTLPESWKGYSIVTSEWAGEVYDKDGNRTANDERGPELIIRHPLWTKVKPRQDIPLMIFTRAQWDLIKRDRMDVSAAPIGPGDIGRNAKYVFALPPRYIDDDLIGSDEELYTRFEAH